MGGDTFRIGRLFSKITPSYQGDKDGKFKGRVVFDGSDVVDLGNNAALCQSFSSCPAAMQASRTADASGL
eukprot:2503013-Pyramimonas_sp.AAC.1